MGKLNCMLDVINHLKTASGNDMPLQQAAVFLMIAENPGISALEICKKLDMTQSSVSRNLAALGQIHRLGKPGLQWVVSREDPMERRRKTLELTPKGQKVINGLGKIIDKRMSK